MTKPISPAGRYRELGKSFKRYLTPDEKIKLVEEAEENPYIGLYWEYIKNNVKRTNI